MRLLDWFFNRKRSEGTLDAGAPNPWVNTLREAAMHGDVPRIIEALERGTPVDVAIDSIGGTALITAAANGHNPAVEALISRGASVTARTSGGDTALHYAAQMNQATTISLLLAHGANLHARDGYGCEAVFDAAIAGQVEALTVLLDAGADTECRHGKTGATPLGQASALGQLNAVQCLVERGARIDSVAYAGRTPLYAALTAGEKDVAAWLLAQGASIDHVDGDGAMAIHHAVWGGLYKITERLVAAGADVNVQDGLGRTPLHLAVLRGFANLRRLLTERGALLTIRDKNDKRALDYEEEWKAASFDQRLWGLMRQLPDRMRPIDLHHIATELERVEDYKTEEERQRVLYMLEDIVHSYPSSAEGEGAGIAHRSITDAHLKRYNVVLEQLE